MKSQQVINFERIQKAIEFISENHKQQPSLDEIAAHVYMSSSHFQRMFSDWAGVSPKKFLEYISLSHAKTVLENSDNNMLITSHELGLSSSGRLHDLFVKIEWMTPWEYKNAWVGLVINYSYHDTLFGEILIASTTKWICYMWFSWEEKKVFSELEARFENATFVEKIDDIQKNALQIYSKDWSNIEEIKLHLKGTDFQLQVWQALLQIPAGNLSTYGKLAEKIGRPKAMRAVGTAIWKNPVSFLIPCHRVIQATWAIGWYMWNPSRKTLMIGSETLQADLK